MKKKSDGIYVAVFDSGYLRGNSAQPGGCIGSLPWVIMDGIGSVMPWRSTSSGLAVIRKPAPVPAI